MTTILGIQGVQKIAPQIDEFLAGDASLVWLQIGDSNLSQGGGGYGYTTRISIGRVTGRPQIATHTASAGVYTGDNLSYSSDGSTSDFLPDTLRPSSQGDQFHNDDYTHAEVLAASRPFLPTTPAMRNVDGFIPAFPEPGDTLDTPRYSLIHDPSDPTGYNFEERFKIWYAYPKHATDFGTHPWRVRRQTSSTLVASGTINQVGATGITVESVGDIAAGSPWLAGTLVQGDILQFLPFSVLQTPSGTPEAGPNHMCLSMFATWPDRDHGYAVMPLNVDGGGSLNDYILAIADADDEWTDWKLIAACAAMEGRRAHVIVEIQHALNEDTIEATFLTRLTTATNHLLARFDALKTAGTIPSTVVGMTILYSGCRHRIPAATENLAYCYDAARTLEATNSRLVVADFRTLMTEAEFAVIGDGTAHLTSDANYLMHDRRWCSRFFTACRLARNLRRFAA